MGKATAVLPWLDEEIAAHYRSAKDHGEIIRILAELNGTTPNRIRRVLNAQGIEPERIAPTPRQMAQIKIMLEYEGDRYTVYEVARMHRMGPVTVRGMCREQERVTFGDKTYKIIRYRRG